MLFLLLLLSLLVVCFIVVRSRETKGKIHEIEIEKQQQQQKKNPKRELNMMTYNQLKCVRYYTGYNTCFKYGQMTNQMDGNSQLKWTAHIFLLTTLAFFSRVCLLCRRNK